MLFTIGEGAFGMGIGCLAEATYPVDLTTLSTPYTYCAKLPFRGREIPVLQLAHLFGFAEGRPHPGQRVLVIHSGDIWVGFLVDQVLEVVEVSPQEIVPMPEMLTLLDPRFFRGLVRRDSNIIILLDPLPLAALDEVSYFYSFRDEGGSAG
ncbi:MAG: chemotaxis protein CheW [candidate division NC10 bacterium]|nr:chemotaxis protein CheW [candidate division NC10 bacterium]